MRTSSPFWLWRGIWAGSLLIGAGVLLLYAWLPADGATGDLASFTSQGFRVQWLLEKREGGLRPEDVIVRAGGHTIDEWLAGAPRGPGWRTGGVVPYEILRNGQPMTLGVRLSSVPFRAILVRWALQFVVALAFLSVGTFVFWKRPQELTARLLMFLCVTIALQYLGDAYNFQYATLPWHWPFWVHLAYEHGMYGLGIASACYFALVFPVPHPLVERFPRLVPFVLYVSFPIVILGAMALSPTWSAALQNGNSASWVIAMAQIGVTVGAGIRSARTARDPVTRAQMRWILWCLGVGVAVLIPSYVLPLMITGRALLPHPVTMLFIALVPFALAVAILRYRLFDIEVIINRTLVYGTLTLLLGSLYLLLVRLLTLLIQEVLQQRNDTLVVFIATLSIALASAPLRQRVQALIDRTFYRTKLDYRRLLPEMSERLAASIVLDQLTSLLTKELPQRLQIAWATLAVLDPEGKHFVAAGDGSDHRTLPVDHPLLKYLRHRGRPLIHLQPPPDLPSEARRFLEQRGIELSVSLTVGTEQVGLYNLGPKLSGDAYSRDEVRLLHFLGQQAAVAVENARLHAETERKLREQTILREAGLIISSALDSKTVLSRIAEQMAQVVDATSAYICTYEPETGTSCPVAEYFGPQACAQERVSDLGAYYVEDDPDFFKIMQAGQYDISRIDDPELPESDQSHMEQYGAQTILYIPLRVKGQLIGFTELWESRQQREFTPAEIALCQDLAQQAAIALENAQLFEQAQQEIAERIRAQELIKASLDEKEVLLKEIHHRVKNNLQVISSLLYLQSKGVENEQTLEIFRDSQSRIRSMALVHEKLYQSADLVKIDFDEYARSLANDLLRSHGVGLRPVELAIDIAGVYLSINAAIPCGLILNELVSNALKHAFSDGRQGVIRVASGLEQTGRYKLVVSDNGVGFPEELDFRNTKSLGLQLVNNLVHQLDGVIELDRRDGTAFKITFADPAYEKEK